MTIQQMDKMTAGEIRAHEDKYTAFDEKQSLEDYTTAIRDIIYLWQFTSESCKSYDIDYANRRVKGNKNQIKALYHEKEPAAYAAIDVDYCCG